MSLVIAFLRRPAPESSRRHHLPPRSAPARRRIAAAACLAVGICGCGDGTGTEVGASNDGNAEPATGTLSLSIAQIQGSGAASPYPGREVSTRGVVTRIAGGGFFIQDATCDVTRGSSCGLFVFDADPGAVPGRLVEVEGRVTEYDPTHATTPGNPTLTELTGVTSVRALGAGAVIAPVTLAWPPSSADLAAHESMLVSVTGPFTVQQNFFLGRYGNATLATGGRTLAPTELALPGAPARAAEAANRRRTLLLDDGDSMQDPDPVPWLASDGTLRAGDQVDKLTGVLDLGLPAPGALPALPRLRPTALPSFARTNPRPAAPADVGGEIRVASANLDNFFLTVADGQGHCAPSGTPADCRGARSAAELKRQEAKLVEELVGLDADAIALMEVQNDGGLAVQALVAALNDRIGSPGYAPVPDPATGVGSDAIRVALIYRPDHLQLVGASWSDASPVHERYPVAQVFESRDGASTFGLVASHFKSKNCGTATGADRDFGDGQGCWNARRVAQAEALATFANSLAKRSETSNLLLVGDFNACSQEDPVRQLMAAGWIDQTARFEAGAYSYVFSGAACQLDHVYASASMSGHVTGTTDWHVDADEPAVLDYTLSFKQPACGRCAPDGFTVSPYRASDHDPVLVGIGSLAGRPSSLDQNAQGVAQRASPSRRKPAP